MGFLDKIAEQFKQKLDNKEAKDDGVGPVNSVEDQSNDEKKLIAYVKNKVEEGRNTSSRTANEGLWMTNTAYVLGFDSVYYDTQSRQFNAVGSNGRASNFLRRDRIHVNKILPTLQRRQAKLCKNQPKYEVKPDSSADEAKDVARLEMNILDDIWDRERINEKRLIMAMGIQSAGHWYFKVGYDTEKGELIPKTLDEGNTEYEYEGNVSVDLVSPFEIFPDPLAKDFDELRYLTQAKVRPLDYFKTHYPERGHLVKQEDAWLLSMQYEARINSLVGQGPAQTGTVSQIKDSAIEISYYEKRSRQFPNGRLVVTANGVLLEDKELPVGELPFAMFCDVQIAGKYYPEAIVTHLRPIQDQFNRTITKRAQWTNRLLAGKYTAPKGSALAQESLNDQSGEVLYWQPVPNAPSGVQQLNIPMIPQYAYTEEDRLNQMFYDIAGDSDISRGILPAAGIPAIGMQLLLEQDETRIAVETEQHEHAFARIGKLALMYAEKFVTNERLLKIGGPNDQYIIKKWSGSDLKSKHDVTVIRGSLAPNSKAVRRNDIMNLYQAGMLGPVQDPSTVQKTLKAMEFGDVKNVWEDLSLDMAQIKKTIDMMENNRSPEVDELDNHALHIQEKNRFRKSDKWDSLTPEVQALVKADINFHVQELMKLTAPQFGMSPDGESEVDLNAQQMNAEAQNALGPDAGSPGGIGGAPQPINPAELALANTNNKEMAG